MEKFFIIDAVNYLFRSYYAIGPMTNDQGISTSALYGFIRSIKKIIKEFSPKYVIAVFDGPDNKQSRLAFFADYKMHRKKAPDDLYPQFNLAHDFCEMAGIKSICVPGVEADDTMASIATWAKDQKFEVYICTSDKDLAQIVQDNVYILNAHKNNLIVDKEKVKELYGIEPGQMLDYLSIMGDASDNIPGISGFGPKTASSLLQQFGTLDNIFNNIDKVQGKKKQETLKEQKDQALLSKKLASLNMEIDFPHEKDFFLLQKEDKEKLNNFYREMKFITLLKDLSEEKDKTSFPEQKRDYVCINDSESLKDLILKLSNEKEIAIDTETTGLDVMQADLVGIGLCYHKNKAWYIPLNGTISKDEVIKSIKQLTENPNISFYGHNLKYDFHILLKYGIEIKNICFDTILASYLINPQNRRHNIDRLVLEKFDVKKISIDELIGSRKNQISMKDVPISKVCEYCCEDVDFTFQLKEIFKKEIKDNDLSHVLYDIEIPLIPVLAKMEQHGIFIDKNIFQNLSIEFTEKLKLLKQEIFDNVGKEFNINSPKQLSEVLYKDLLIPAPRKKATEYSTAAKVLEKLAHDYPIVEKILKFRGFQKLLSTYIDSLPQQVNIRTNRIHSTFNQSATATGRLSSQDPNLQNIPIRTQEGMRIREGFKPQKHDWSYISSDYSQIELRLLAHFSEDPELIKAFNNNEDIHEYTASLVFHVPKEEVTKEMRYMAKAVNFGIIYGQGAFGLSEQLKIPHREAAAFIKTYFERYPLIENFLEKCKQEAYETGKITTLTGRHRPLHDIYNKNPHIKAAANRLAINTPLQGTAADIIKLAMIEIDKEITNKGLEGFLIIQVHDELIYEVPDSEISVFKGLIRDKMENIYKLKVPITTDIQVGKNWKEC